MLSICVTLNLLFYICNIKHRLLGTFWCGRTFFNNILIWLGNILWIYILSCIPSSLGFPPRLSRRLNYLWSTKIIRWRTNKPFEIFIWLSWVLGLFWLTLWAEDWVLFVILRPFTTLYSASILFIRYAPVFIFVVPTCSCISWLFSSMIFLDQHVLNRRSNFVVLFIFLVCGDNLLLFDCRLRSVYLLFLLRLRLLWFRLNTLPDLLLLLNHGFDSNRNRVLETLCLCCVFLKKQIISCWQIIVFIILNSLLD